MDWPREHFYPLQDREQSLIYEPVIAERQVIVLAGNVVTLPGLPRCPNAIDIDLTESEQVAGLI